jgi:hypothetical protein
MDVHYPPLDEPATPEYILAVLQDMHRQQCQWDPEADSGTELTLETTVAEWRDACDLLGWKPLGRAYNVFWGVSITDAEWRAVLEPAQEKRLADAIAPLPALSSQFVRYFTTREKRPPAKLRPRHR